MNENGNRESISTEGTPDPLSRVAGLSARRRFLVSGAKLAPVVAATLASRPSLACHCVMPSAWGSINAALGGNQDMGTTAVQTLTGSVTRSYQGIIQADFTPYVISAWTGSAANCKAAWEALVNVCPASTWPSGLLSGCGTDALKLERKILYLKGLYTNNSTISYLKVTDLCNKLSLTAPKNVGIGRPQETITGGGFKASILVAQFNVKLIAITKIPSLCVTQTMLAQMAGVTFKPSGASQPWTTTQIEEYLHNNWIARRA